MIDTSRFRNLDEVENTILFSAEQQMIISNTVDKLLSYKHPLLKKVEFISLWLLIKGMFRLKFLKELAFIYEKTQQIINDIFDDPYLNIEGIFDSPEYEGHRLLISIIMSGLHALKSILILKLIIEEFEKKQKESRITGKIDEAKAQGKKA